MGLRYGRLRAAMAGALLAAALWSGPAIAADPPPGVVTDGVVTVTWIDDVDLLPVESATITVLAWVDDAAEPFQAVDGTTDAAGVAVIEGVARPGPDGPTFSLSVAGQKNEGPVVGDDGCSVSLSWSAAAGPLSPAEEVAVVFEETTFASSLSCPNNPPSGAVAALTSRPVVTPPNTSTAPMAEGGVPVSIGPILLAVLVVAGTAVVATLPARRIQRGVVRRRS